MCRWTDSAKLTEGVGGRTVLNCTEGVGGWTDSAKLTEGVGGRTVLNLRRV